MLDAERPPHDALGELDPLDASLATTASPRVLGYMEDIAGHIGEYPLDLVMARARRSSDRGGKELAS